MSKRGRLWGWALVLTLATAPAVAAAGPVEEARAVVEEGRKILAQAQKRSRKRPLLLAEGLRKYANAYLLITRRKLENDAPDLLQEISDTIKATNELPEVELMRQELLKKAIDAVEAGELTQAYDHLASLRDLDPRSLEVEFALTVIGQRMEGG